MKKSFKFIALPILFCWMHSAGAAVKVFSCEPEWASLVQELGGEKVLVTSATTALQDVHHIQARPSLISKTRNADLVVCTGAELEVGWLPLLIRQSGNPKISPGNSGYFEAANYVRMLDVPSRVDRSEGDVHPSGNPHIQTDPRNIAKVAAALTKRLQEIDPASAAFYQARFNSFNTRWNAAMNRWEKDARPLKGMSIVVHHKGWDYMNKWLGLIEAGELEPKPGVEPTASHLETLTSALKHSPAKLIIRAAYDDPHASEWLSERTGIPSLALPYTVGGDEKAKDLFSFFDETLRLLLQGMR